jgi:hypothetical protein
MRFCMLLVLATAGSCADIYIGCYTDMATGQRDLNHTFCSSGSSWNGVYCTEDPDGLHPWAGMYVMTPGFCRGLCTGFKYYGVQNGGNSCFCGNDYGTKGNHKADESNCKSPCYGDLNQTCGGLNHNAIYAPPPPVERA